MTTNYLDAARQGKNKWWQYALVVTIFPLNTFIVTTIILTICLLAFTSVNLSDYQYRELLPKILKTLPLWGVYMFSIPYFSLICGSILVGIETLHQRKFLSVICPDRIFNIKRYLHALIIWLGMSLSFNIFNYIFNHQAFELVFDPIQWSIYLIPTIIFAFVTALLQEITRGYIIQGLGLIIRHRFLIIFISATLAALMSLIINSKSHSIPLQSTIISFIFCIGLATVILKENGLELALGIQTAKGLTAVFVSTQFSDTSFIFPSIYRVNISDQIYPSLLNIGLILLSIKLAVFYAVFLRKTRISSHE